MKKIGLVGGISWTSTIDYYRLINEEANKRMGSLNFAECIIYSVNFNDFAKITAAYDWMGLSELLSKATLKLESAGADLIVLCANTAHIVIDKIIKEISLPIIDIRIAIANDIKQKGLTKVGLLGTVYTMELDFYKSKLLELGIEAITPGSKKERDYIEDTLLNELGKGILSTTTKASYLQIANKLIEQGAEGIILGCTEIPLLLSQSDFSVPVFNSTEIHAQAAVTYALSAD